MQRTVATQAGFYKWKDVPLFIDVPMAMRLLGLSRPTVLKLCKTGVLPAGKIGTDWRIDRDELRKYIKGGE